jgi:hypothetical protein
MTKRRVGLVPSIFLAAAATAASCSFQDLDQWETQGAAEYCGGIVTLPEVYTPPANDGFQPDLQVAMTFDPNALETTPGTVTTNDPNGPCDPSVTFDKAPLRLISELQHDPLSTFTFGIGRTYNFMAWVTSTCRGSMLAVVSLMSDGSAEFRLIKDISPDPPPVATDPTAGFALFPLSRISDGCGF